MASAPDLRSGLTRPLRFLFAGGLNTLFGFAVFGALAWTGWPTWACLLVGNLAGTAFNFLTLGGFVFRDLHQRRLPRFVAVYVLIYLLNLGLLAMAQRMDIDRLIAQFGLLIPIAAMSYLLMSRLVFKSR